MGLGQETIKCSLTEEYFLGLLNSFFYLKNMWYTVTTRKITEEERSTFEYAKNNGFTNEEDELPEFLGVVDYVDGDMEYQVYLDELKMNFEENTRVLVIELFDFIKTKEERRRSHQ